MPRPDDDPKASRPATEVLLRLAAGDRDKAARLLLDAYTGPLTGMFMRNSLRHLAEEMLSDTFFKFLNVKNPLEVADHAEPYLYSVARSVLLDYARKRAALSRGGGAKDGPAEVLMDDEELLEALAASDEPSADPEWHKALVDCVHKALAFMRLKLPKIAEVLWLKYRDYTPEEVAIYYGADPARLTPRIVANARQRLSAAYPQARSYFEHCKD